MRHFQVLLSLLLGVSVTYPSANAASIDTVFFMAARPALHKNLAADLSKIRTAGDLVKDLRAKQGQDFSDVLADYFKRKKIPNTMPMPSCKYADSQIQCGSARIEVKTPGLISINGKNISFDSTATPLEQMRAFLKGLDRMDYSFTDSKLHLLLGIQRAEAFAPLIALAATGIVGYVIYKNHLCTMGMTTKHKVVCESGKLKYYSCQDEISDDEVDTIKRQEDVSECIARNSQDKTCEEKAKAITDECLSKVKKGDNIITDALRGKAAQ